MSDPQAIVEASEFGSGVVVCLAKFSEHLWNDSYQRIRYGIWWAALGEKDREKQRTEAARFPHGDAARRLLDVTSASSVYRTADEALSSQIEMWMNGASDHFYDLNEEKAPPELRALASLTLRVGHGFAGETWTQDTVNEIQKLWQDACLAVDRLLGVEPDWGQW